MANYGPKDKVICINATKESTLIRGAEYTCHDIWECDGELMTDMEELPLVEAPLHVILSIHAKAPCIYCGKPMEPFYTYEAYRFIKKPDPKDFQNEEDENLAERLILARSILHD